MVGGVTMSGVNNGKFVIDFRSSQSSTGAFMHSLNGRKRRRTAVFAVCSITVPLYLLLRECVA